MVWFFAIALAVSVLSCPAGFVVELLFPSDCESNAVRVSRENLCFASHAMTVWANAYWGVITCAVLGLITLLVIAIRAVVRGIRRPAPAATPGQDAPPVR